MNNLHLLRSTQSGRWGWPARLVDGAARRSAWIGEAAVGPAAPAAAGCLSACGRCPALLVAAGMSRRTHQA
ncbi:MAG: hypothetical protein ACXVHX_17915 [Solirubrobacteraceae bacterium]